MSHDSTPTSRINPRRYELAGQRFGRLVVIDRSFKKYHWHWRCVCDCGTEKDICQILLIQGKTNSCGCLRQKLVGDRSRTHGGASRPEYKIWGGIKKRCLNPASPAYKNYGGRGIKICDRWLHDFAAFLADMGPRPSPSHSIDRIDNNGDYCPENCRWATDGEQSRNTRVNRIVEFGGKSMPACDWDKELGFTPGTVKNRLHRGWTVERILTTPLRQWPKN